MLVEDWLAPRDHEEEAEEVKLLDVDCDELVEDVSDWD